MVGCKQPDSRSCFTWMTAGIKGRGLLGMHSGNRMCSGNLWSTHCCCSKIEEVELEDIDGLPYPLSIITTITTTTTKSSISSLCGCGRIPCYCSACTHNTLPKLLLSDPTQVPRKWLNHSHAVKWKDAGNGEER